jgi:hypothetical protein
VKRQRDAVFAAVTKHAKSNKISDEARQKIYAQLEREFVDGKIVLAPTESNLEKLAEPRLLRNYVIGLVANWLRKDERLAGKKAA